MDLNHVIEQALANAPQAAALFFVVWWGQRDANRLLRAIAKRMSVLLDRVGLDDAGQPRRRARSQPHMMAVADLDDAPRVSRTITDEDLDERHGR